MFKSNGKVFYRLSDEFNIKNKGKLEPTFDLSDAYRNLLSFDEMLNFDKKNALAEDYSGRTLADLDIISKTDSVKLNEALYWILHTI